MLKKGYNKTKAPQGLVNMGEMYQVAFGKGR